MLKALLLWNLKRLKEKTVETATELKVKRKHSATLELNCDKLTADNMVSMLL